MKIRAVLTIIISLLVGFVFGYLTSGQLVKHEMQKRRSHSYQETFVFRTLSVIHPTENQKDSIMPILNNYATRAVTLKDKVSKDFEALMTEMKLELKPYLTEEQFKMLQENNERHKRKPER